MQKQGNGWRVTAITTLTGQQLYLLAPLLPLMAPSSMLTLPATLHALSGTSTTNVTPFDTMRGVRIGGV
jgi:hypothetical protein